MILYSVTAGNPDGTCHVSVWSSQEAAEKKKRSIKTQRNYYAACDWCEIVPFKPDDDKDISSIVHD